jgi:hypothetical protein
MTAEETAERFTFGAAVLAAAFSTIPPQPMMSSRINAVTEVVQEIGGYALVSIVPGYDFTPMVESRRYAFDQSTTLALVSSSEPAETVAERFHQLAAEWSKEVQHISSLTLMVENPKYREIVKMGWDVVPFLLVDLERNRRFWIPALREITGIKPYDSFDVGNTKRMMQAWIRWGKNKNYLAK